MSDRLSPDIQDNERRKFKETPVGQKVAVRVCADATDPLPVSGTFSAGGPTTVKIFNHVTSATPGTETSEALTTGTKKLLVRCRDACEIQFSFVSTESGTKFVTIPKGGTLNIDGIDFSGTIYLQANKASQVVEILEWST